MKVVIQSFMALLLAVVSLSAFADSGERTRAMLASLDLAVVSGKINLDTGKKVSRGTFACASDALEMREFKLPKSDRVFQGVIASGESEFQLTKAGGRSTPRSTGSFNVHGKPVRGTTLDVVYVLHCAGTDLAEIPMTDAPLAEPRAMTVSLPGKLTHVGTALVGDVEVQVFERDGSVARLVLLGGAMGKYVQVIDFRDVENIGATTVPLQIAFTIPGESEKQLSVSFAVGQQLAEQERLQNALAASGGGAD